MSSRPSKKDVALAILERSNVTIQLDPRAHGVVVPAEFKRAPTLVLEVGPHATPPIRDLQVDDAGLRCTLSFHQSPFQCAIPWPSIYRLVGDDGRGLTWPEDTPADLGDEGPAAPATRIDVARLGELGFFRYVAAAEDERVRRAFAEATSLFDACDSVAPGGGATRRIYDFDAETVGEGEALQVIGRLAPFLRREGVPIDVTYGEVRVPAMTGRASYVGAARLDADGWLDEAGPEPHVQRLTVSFGNGHAPCTLEEEGGVLIAGERTILLVRDPTENVWAQAIASVLRLVNELLVAQRSPERAHALYFGSNNLLVVLATPEMARVLNAVEEDPWRRLHDGFGQEVA